MGLISAHTDVELVELLKAGNEVAFDEIYERYWDKLLFRAKVILDSDEDAEEAVHDIFVILWKKKASIDIRHTFNTYIAAMLRYRCFKILASRRQRNQGCNESDLPEISDNATQNYLDFENLREQLEKAVTGLPEKCQLIFRLSREEGLTDKQIASKLNLSANTVRTQMQRALRKLRTSLDTFFIL